MADVVRTTRSLSLVAEFKDGDDRTINLDNPKGGLSAANINALNTPAAAVLIGDKEQSEFLRFKSAETRTQRTVYYDLTTG